MRTELGSWRSAWRRVGKVGKAEVEVEQGGSGGGRGGGEEEGGQLVEEEEEEEKAEEEAGMCSDKI